MEHMDKITQLFLEALRCSLRGKKVSWEEGLLPDEWMHLFQIANRHQVLPLIFDCVHDCAAAKKTDPQLFILYRQRVVQLVTMQMMRTNDFLNVYQKLEEQKIIPVVVKGIICRSLYPNPDYRISGDEDIQVNRSDYPICHRILLEQGLIVPEKELDIEMAHEVPYRRPGSSLYIEVHKQLFPPESEAYGDLNDFFETYRDNMIQMSVEGHLIHTMGYTDHLFYLICHAFKHFLHSGFGMRQVCDIILFAEEYGKEIEWDEILDKCRKIRGDLFAASLFRIGEKYLGFDMEKARYPETWKTIEVDEQPLLDDLLDAGVFGDGSMSRKHSSNMTLNAAAAQKKGRRNGNGIVKSLFPPLASMSGTYTYLKAKPYLLPAAWVQRILKYRKELGAGGDNSASESIRIGNQRIKLLEKYGIIQSNHKNGVK